MNRRLLFAFPALALLLLPVTAYANSSWVWLTQTTPLTVLPFAVAGTLSVEILAVIFIIRPQKRLLAAAAIALANLFSFLAGFFLGAIRLDGVGYTITDVIMHTPHYIISGLYLTLTLLIELPAVYLSIRRHTIKTKLLIALIIVSNTATTIIVSVFEGIFAPGAW